MSNYITYFKMFAHYILNILKCTFLGFCIGKATKLLLG